MAIFGKKPKPTGGAKRKSESEPLSGQLLLRDDYEGVGETSPGRPRIYDSPEQFNEAVAAYYLACQEHREPLTLTGLCLFMGFSGRQALFNYSAYEGFLDAVTRARSLVQYGYERAVIMDKNSAAARLLGCMDDYWNPATKIEVPGIGSHEDRLGHLR